MPTYEGLWNCATPSCGKVGIPGLTKNCPDCGLPRDVTNQPSERPYPGTSRQTITDPEKQRRASAGPDWNCGEPGCGEINDGDTNKCRRCGNRRSGDDFVSPTTEYLGGNMADGVVFTDPGQPDRDRADAIIPDELQHAQDVISGEADKPRVSHGYRRPIEDLPGTHTTTALEQDDDDSLLEDAQEFIEENGPTIAGVIGTLVIFSIIAGVLWSSFLRTEPVELTVRQLTWERNVEVEEYRTLHESNWSVPAGGRETRRYRAIHHYDHVLDHYETEHYTVPVQVYDGQESYSYNCGTRTIDNGNGTFSYETQTCTGSRAKYRTDYQPRTRQVAVYRDDPVYRTKYDYDIERWVFDHWITAKGGTSETTQTPHWPEASNLSPKQRVGANRTEKYWVVLTSDMDRSYQRTLGYSTWVLLKKGEQVTGHVNHKGTLRSVDWPKE